MLVTVMVVTMVLACSCDASHMNLPLVVAFNRVFMRGSFLPARGGGAESSCSSRGGGGGGVVSLLAMFRVIQ